MSSDAWFYFACGAILPTLAYFFQKNNKLKIGGGDDDDEDGSENMTGAGGADASGGDGAQRPSAKWGIGQAPYKLVFCVNDGLKMGKGKIAAQCGHAAVGCYKLAVKQCPAGVKAWEMTGCAKIALRAENEEELERLAYKAMSKDIPVYLVEDAGKTQVASGSRTVLGLGPAPVSAFSGVTDHLRLL